MGRLKNLVEYDMAPRYASDLSDTQWSMIEGLLPQKDSRKGGRPRTWSLREIFNAIFYIEKTGCQWRMIPGDLPPKETVWGHFRQFRDNGTLESIRIALNTKRRVEMGKEPTPTVLIADSQSVKTGQKGGIEAMMVEN
jgi:putative transposase